MSDRGAAPYDFVWSTDVIDRHVHSEELARALLEDSAKETQAVGILSRASLSGFEHVVTFSAVVPAPVDPILNRWRFRLGDYLFNARATLDNLMWAMAHDKPVEPLTPEEERGLQFPIAATEHEWRSFAGASTARKIRPAILDRVQHLQPYLRPAHSTSRGLNFLQRLHRYDKHRVPLKLSLRLDMQLLPPFGVEAADGGFFTHTEEWLGTEDSLRDGLPLLRRTFDRRMIAPEDRPLHVTMMANFEGEDYDLQDLIWDVQSGLYRAIDHMQAGQHLRADLFEGEVGWRRESLAALRRSITDHTDEWSDRGFDKPSPWAGMIAALNEEVKKSAPDLSRFTNHGHDAKGRSVWLADDHPFNRPPPRGD